MIILVSANYMGERQGRSTECNNTSKWIFLFLFIFLIFFLSILFYIFYEAPLLFCWGEIFIFDLFPNLLFSVAISFSMNFTESIAFKKKTHLFAHLIFVLSFTASRVWYRRVMITHHIIFSPSLFQSLKVCIWNNALWEAFIPTLFQLVIFFSIIKACLND